MTKPMPQQAKRGAAEETLIIYGESRVSDAQLIELVLQEPSISRAVSILQACDGINGLLRRSPFELSSEHGLSALEGARIAALPEILRRYTQQPERVHIVSPRTAAEYLGTKVVGYTEERFGMLALDAKGALIADRTLATGTASACMISPREFFREALRAGAVSTVAWHNHPSGDVAPSLEDQRLTSRLRRCGRDLGVELLDHLVLSSCMGVWHSFRVSERWEQEPSVLTHWDEQAGGV